MWVCVCVCVIVGFVKCGFVCVFCNVSVCVCIVGLVLCGCPYVWVLYCVGVCVCVGLYCVGV